MNAVFFPNTTRRISSGFTIIELIVVFSVLAIISTVGIASFVTYTNSQKLRNASLEIRTMLQQARSQSLAQVKPASCGTLQGYVVRVCCVPSGSNCPTCLSAGNYELDALCSSVPSGVLMTSKTLPDGVSINNNGTSQRSFQFIPISGGVVQGGMITLDGVNGQKQIATVSATGVIQ